MKLPDLSKLDQKYMWITRETCGGTWYCYTPVWGPDIESKYGPGVVFLFLVWEGADGKWRCSNARYKTKKYFARRFPTLKAAKAYVEKEYLNALFDGEVVHGKS